MSTSQVSLKSRAVLLKNIRTLDLHFKLPNLQMLPDEVYLDIPKDFSENKRDLKFCPKGCLIFFEFSVALPELFFCLEKSGFPNVGFRGDWIQQDMPLNDRFNVHFCFVPHEERDLRKAIRHRSEEARIAFDKLASHYWNVSAFSNGSGSFDFTFHKPKEKSEGLALLVDKEYLGVR